MKINSELYSIRVKLRAGELGLEKIRDRKKFKKIFGINYDTFCRHRNNGRITDISYIKMKNRGVDFDGVLIEKDSQ